MLPTAMTHRRKPRRTAGPDAAPRGATRYAIYFAPEPGTPLARFGRTWFGYDAETGEAVEERQTYGLEPDFADRITAVPKRYGLHGTLRAPFRPRTGISFDILSRRAELLARRTAPVVLPPLVLQRLGRFLALCPTGPARQLHRLHAKCLFAFEEFRAEPDAKHRARRLATPLSTNQRILLAEFGYPYVLEEFRFHVTLTGPLTDHEQARVAPALAPALKDSCLEPFVIGSICLFAEDGAGQPFRCLARHPLGGGTPCRLA